MGSCLFLAAELKLKDLILIELEKGCNHLKDEVVKGCVVWFLWYAMVLWVMMCGMMMHAVVLM